MKKSSHNRKAELRLVVSVPNISQFKLRDFAAVLNALSNETRRPVQVNRILKFCLDEVLALAITPSSIQDHYAYLQLLREQES